MTHELLIEKGFKLNEFAECEFYNWLRIASATVDRNINRDWYHANHKPYIEIEMSTSQFAEAITSLNQGDGVPVTLKYLNGKRTEECPFKNKRQEFENDFKNKMKELSHRLDSLTKNTEEILNSKKNLVKKDKEIILEEIAMLRQEINSNLPYMGNCFNEQMDKTVLEAKGEVEGFILNKIISTGIEGLKNEFKMLED